MSGLDFGVTGGQDLPKQRVQIEEDTKRDFRFTERLLSEYGFTVGCKGCEVKLTGNGVKPHSHECGARLEEVRRAAVRDADVLHRRDARMRQSVHEWQHTRRGGSHARENETDQTTASQTQNPENVQHEVVVEHAKRKAVADTVADERPSKKQRLALITRMEEQIQQALRNISTHKDGPAHAMYTLKTLSFGSVSSTRRPCIR